MRSFSGLRRVLLGRHRVRTGRRPINDVSVSATVPGGAQELSCFAGPVAERSGPAPPTTSRRGRRVHARTACPPGRDSPSASRSSPGLVTDNAPPGAGRQQADRGREGRADRAGRRRRGARCRLARSSGPCGGARTAATSGTPVWRPARSRCRDSRRTWCRSDPDLRDPGRLHPAAHPGRRGRAADRRPGRHPGDRGDHHRPGRPGRADGAEHGQEGLPGHPGRPEPGRRRRTRWCC